MSTPLLSVTGISVHFGGVVALAEVSFELAGGELLGLIGPNGAGKTTLLRVVTGVVQPRRGRVELAGRVLDGLPTHRRVRAGLAFSQQLVRPFHNMTLLDNVALAAGGALTRTPLRALTATSRAAARARARELLALLGIEDAAGALPVELPLGFLKRLEVARALATAPRVLLLDEPLAGLNTVEAAQLADTIVALNRDGRTVILIEHNLGEVLRICSRLVVLDNGRRIAAGAPQAVMAERAVRAAYLGERGSDAAA